MKAEIEKILRQWCERKANDSNGMLSRLYTYADWYTAPYSVAEMVGYLKEKSSRIIFDRHANLKYKYGNRRFWCREYYVDTVGKNTKKIRE